MPDAMLVPPRDIVGLVVNKETRGNNMGEVFGREMPRMFDESGRGSQTHS